MSGRPQWTEDRYTRVIAAVVEKIAKLHPDNTGDRAECMSAEMDIGEVAEGGATTLAIDDRRALAAHLDGCVPCRAVVASIFVDGWKGPRP